ncbi:MAG TPA: restriction endonuclease [Firmicutes bacterium]|nr:restriction endonuclease [Bacillota bacterium]
MSKFNNEKLDGRLFGHPGELIVAPLLSTPGSIIVKLPTSGEYQIDAYGYYDQGGERHIWMAECKYRKGQPMTAQEVKKAFEAADVVREMQRGKDVTVWLVSSGGFTNEALELIRESNLRGGQSAVSEPQRIVGEPQGIASEPQSMVSDPQRMVSEPKRVRCLFSGRDEINEILASYGVEVKIVELE